MATPNQIYQGLLDRGLQEHHALAFMDSFMSESGLNPGINEKNPVVKGSRGGRGLYQLTGPRRTAYEAKYGEGYDIDSQLDWLMHELEGEESKAAEKIFATQSREDAVRSITKDFLRPLKDNSDHRIGAWTGQPIALGPTQALAASGKGLATRDVPKDPWMEEEYADNLLGRMSEKRDTMRKGLGEKMGLERKQMAGIGNALSELSQYLMEG